MCVIARRIECILMVWYTSNVWVPKIAKPAQTGEKSDVNDHVVGFDQNDFVVIYMCCGTPQIAPILRMRGSLHFLVELWRKVGVFHVFLVVFGGHAPKIRIFSQNMGFLNSALFALTFDEILFQAMPRKPTATCM
jgi:hypothetical protein